MLLGHIPCGVRDGAWLVELLNSVVDTDLKRQLIGHQQAILGKDVTNGANRPRNARFPAILVPLVDQSLDGFSRCRVDGRYGVRLEHNEPQGWAFEMHKSLHFRFKMSYRACLMLKYIIIFGQLSWDCYHHYFW